MAKPNVEALKVFISYSRADMRAADAMVAALEERGFAVTIDRRDLPYGEEWQGELSDFIKGSDTVVWLVSPSSVGSRWVNWELGEVQRINKRLIPVAIAATAADQLPEALGKIHLLPAEGVYDSAAHLDALVEALETDRAWIKEHSRLGDHARQWISRGRTPDRLLRGGALRDADNWRARQPTKAPPPAQEVLDLIAASERGARRRARRMIGVLSLAVILMVGLSATALVQWRIAVDQRRIAVANEQRAIANEQRAIAGEQLAAENADRAAAETARAETEAERAAAGEQLAAENASRAETQSSRADAEAARAAEERDAALLAESHSLASFAEEYRAAGDTDGALALAWEALPHDDALSERPLSSEALSMLAAARYERREVSVLRGHAGGVTSVAFSPDGARVFTASKDGTQRVWTPSTGEAIAVLSGGRMDMFLNSALEPEADVAHAGSADSTGPSASGPVPLAFSRDGRRVISVRPDAAAVVRDAASGAQTAILRGHEERVTSAALSPDGTRAVTGLSDGTARIWDAETGAEIAVLRGHQDANEPGAGHGYVTSVAFSPDGALVATGSTDTTARVWDSRTGDAVAVLNGHTLPVWSVAFSPDGARLATGAGSQIGSVRDNTARLWSIATGAQIAVLRGHESAVTSVAYIPDGRRVVTGSADATVRVWDALTGMEAAVLQGHEAAVSSLSVSPDGALAITGSRDGTARVWSLLGGVEVTVLDGDGGPIRSAVFSPDGALVVGGADDGSAWTWDAATGAAISTARAQTSVTDVAVSRDGSVVFTRQGDGAARAWDSRSGEEVSLPLRALRFDMAPALFSPDGARALMGAPTSQQGFAAGFGASISVIDTATGTPVAELRGEESDLEAFAFSSSGTRVAAGYWDGSARVWDTETGREIAVLRGHSDGVASVSFSLDGTRLLTKDQQDAIVWDAETGEALATLHGAICCATFSPDGARVVAGAEENAARVWDAETGAEIATLRGHQDRVVSTAFGPKGDFAITGSNDSTARVWDVSTGETIAVLRGHEPDIAGTDIHDGAVTSVAFSPTGTRVLTGSLDGTVRLWPFWTSPQELIRESGQIVERLDPLSLREKCRFVLASDAACAEISE